MAKPNAELPGKKPPADRPIPRTPEWGDRIEKAAQPRPQAPTSEDKDLPIQIKANETGDIRKDLPRNKDQSKDR